MQRPEPPLFAPAPRRPLFLIRILRERRLPPSAELLLIAVGIVIAVVNLTSPTAQDSDDRSPGSDTRMPISIRGRHGGISLHGEPMSGTAPADPAAFSDGEPGTAVRSTSWNQVDSWGCKTGCGAAW